MYAILSQNFFTNIRKIFCLYYKLIYICKKYIMTHKEFTPSESLDLITNIILEAKSRFKDNGFAFIFIGLCCFISSLGQFILLKLEYYKVNYYPYFIMPVAGVITYFYYKKKRSTVKSKNIIGTLLALFGVILGLNLTIAGFFFWEKFDIALLPFMLILFSLWPFLTGVLIRNRLFTALGLIVNIIAYCSFFIGMEYHPLVLSTVSLIGIVLPGIVINYSHKESYV